MLKKVFSWIFFILVCLSLISPVWVFKDLLFPFVTSKAFFFRIVLDAALPFYVYLIVADPKLRPNLKNPLTLSVLVFLLINIISSFTGVSVVRSLFGNFERMGGAFYLAHLTALYFYILVLGQMPGSRLQSFLKCLLAASAFIAVYGLLNYLGILKSILDVFHLSNWYIQDPSLPGRVSSTLGNPIYLGSFSVLPLFISLFFAFQSEKLRSKILYGIYFLLFLWAVFSSGTRGAVVGLLLGSFISAVVYLFFAPNKKVKRAGFAGIMVCVVIASILFSFSNKLPAGSTLQRVFKLRDSNTEARLLQWQVALAGFKDRPILGTGPENYYIIANQYYNPEIAKYDRSWFDKPHNYLLEILVTNGVLGFIAYAAMLFFIASAFYKGFKAGFFDLIEFCFLLAGLIVYQIQNLFVFDTVPASLMFYAFAGFAGYIWNISNTNVVELKKSKNIFVQSNQALSLAVFGVMAVLSAYIIYAGEVMPIMADYNVNYGYAYMSVDSSKALEYFHTALSIPFNFDKTEVAGKFSEFAISYVRTEAAKNPEQGVKILDESIAALNDALQVQPDNPILWERLASVLLYKSVQVDGKFLVNPDAQEAINKANALAPKREEANVTQAQILALGGNIDKANELLRSVIAQYPTDNVVKMQLVSYLRAQGKVDEAISVVEEAQNQGYTFTSYAEAKWVIDYYSAKKFYDKALALQLAAGKVEPNNLQVFVDLAHLYALAGRNDEAKNLAKNIMKFDQTRKVEMQALIDSVAHTATSTK